MQDAIFIQAEAEAAQLFKQAGWARPNKIDVNRVEKIVERAMFQHILKDSTSFIFLGFGAAISSLSSATLGSPDLPGINYKA